MDTKNRLIEREAENQVSEKDLDETDAEMVVEFDIKLMSSVQINYRNLEGDWNELLTLRDLIDVEISDNSIEGNDVVLSDKVGNELKKLQKKVRQSYNEQLDMYQLSYKLNEDESSELYIPLETEFTDDLTVQKIYDENEEFVAQNVEDNVEFPLYELKTKELYIKYIPKNNDDRVQVYSKRGMTWKEIMEKITVDEFRHKDPILAYVASLFIYSTIGSLYMTGSTWMAGGLLFLLSLAYLAPFVIPLYAIISTIQYIYSYVKSKTGGYDKGIPEFKSKV